jgi:hypothetical protein
VHRIVIWVACSLTLAGCSGAGSHAASSSPPATGDQGSLLTSTPPSNHGGFTGDDAKKYDVAFKLCYKVVARSAKANSDNLFTVQVGGGHAASQGCKDGTNHAWAMAGVPPSTSP